MIVAPYVGAWIETIIFNLTFHVSVVAPYVGAWIETYHQTCLATLFVVAPYVGAWIETLSDSRDYVEFMSHPMWVRGLKL